MTRARTAGAALLIVCISTLLAGCGGGGGGNGTDGAVVIGKVVDVNGSPVPAATVRVEGGGPQTTTLSQGSYRLVGVGTGVRRITATVSQNGTGNTGSTQTLVLSQTTTTSNADIQVSPSDQQATVAGNVHDAQGRPLRDARVFLAVFVTPNSSASAGSLSSLVAFADDNGNYRLQNVPAPVSQYTVTASLVGYQNATDTVQNLRVGQTYGKDFTLGASFNQSGLTPTNVAVFSFTQPSGGQQPYAVAQGAGTTSGTTAVYQQIRLAVSPRYAQRAARGHAAAQSHKLQAHEVSQFGPYAVEMDLYFDNNQPDSVSGFRVYNSAGSQALAPYDFLQDPLANVYTDLDPFYQADQPYNFAVSAVNTDGSETAASPASSVLPLGLLTLRPPSLGGTASNPVTVAWNAVNGASDYQVFLYTNGFPSVNAQYQQFDAGGASSYPLPSLGSGDYYVVVAGVTQDGSAVTLSPITKFHVP